MRRLFLMSLMLLGLICGPVAVQAADKYGAVSGDWSATATWSNDDNESGGDSVPADGDTVYIRAGVNVKMDVDQSAFTGLANVTIRGGATPGMLYFSDGDSGHLKIAAGGELEGTTDTNKGRLLANSNGTWGNTTAMAYSNKVVIDLVTTAKVNAQHLDIALYGTNPTNTFVHVYGTKYDFASDTDVNPATDLITLNTSAPAEGTDVVLVAASGGTLPAGLYADRLYYVRDNSGNDCKLATTNDDATIVNITADGTGTIYLLTEQAASTATLNVLEDVTGDSWSATDGHDAVVLVDIGPADYDQQRTSISAIDDADTITLAASVDSAQYAGARLYLSSRNVSIRCSTTTSSQAIVDYSSAPTASGVFQCEIRSTAGTGTTFYGYGISSGSGNTISGSVSGCSYGIYDSSGNTISGSVSGCSTGISYGSGNTISGSVSGCSTGISYGSGNTISGSVSGCSYGIYNSSGNTISGSVSGCSDGISYGSGNTISGSMSGCYNGISYGSGNTISGSVSGCSTGISYGSGNTISGSVKNNTYDFIFPVGFMSLLRGHESTYVTRYLGTAGYNSRISIENYGGTNGDNRVIDNCGNLLKTACDGATADYPDEDPDGGSGDAIEASSLKSIISAINPLYLISDRAPHRFWVAADEKTITYKVYTTFSGSGGIADNGLVIVARYISDDSPLVITKATDSQAIATKTSDTDWTQTLSITFTQAIAGWVDVEIYLVEYEDAEIFIWPVPTIS